MILEIIEIKVFRKFPAIQYAIVQIWNITACSAAMTMGYILNIPCYHGNGICLAPIVMTTGYIRYIHLWFPLI